MFSYFTVEYMVSRLVLVFIARCANINNECCFVTRVVELTGDVTPDMRAIAKADLIVTTPEKWDGVSRSWQTRNYVKAVSLIVIDEIHLLGMQLFLT